MGPRWTQPSRTTTAASGGSATAARPVFLVAKNRPGVTVWDSVEIDANLNSELCRQALAKVGNPNILVNLVSRRVRQLNSGGGAMSRPLIADHTNRPAGDIALLEIIEGKIGFDLPEENQLLEPAPPKRRRKH